MNLRTLLTLGLWAIIAWLLFRACSPKQENPNEVNTDYRPEVFTEAGEAAQVVSLDNGLIHSEWTTEGAGCLEVRLKEFTTSKVTDHIPTADESVVVIRFRDPHGIDFPYLLSMIDRSWMSRANSIVIPGGKLDLGMQLILTPLCGT